ncbi:MAG: hypothetical protein MUP90_04030, partial [Gammaproteobacteria bacterium]|nr:hypothetical protein [Gammaproteobacteria bacterium]
MHWAIVTVRAALAKNQIRDFACFCSPGTAAPLNFVAWPQAGAISVTTPNIDAPQCNSRTVMVRAGLIEPEQGIDFSDFATWHEFCFERPGETKPSGQARPIQKLQGMIMPKTLKTLAAMALLSVMGAAQAEVS